SPSAIDAFTLRAGERAPIGTRTDAVYLSFEIEIEVEVDETLAGCPDRDLGPGLDAELVEDVAHVRVGGALRQHQPLGDLAIGQAVRQQQRDLLLTRRQHWPWRPDNGLRLGQRERDRLVQ